MKTLRFSNGQFRYDEMPITKTYLRMLVRKLAAERAERQLSLERQHRAFEQVAARQGW
ncbi:hypothetical protein ACE2AK_04055 [Rahnella perminowiae]|uniref:hypothetical protein n=1 Tax=Rahnella perminowiae TaxID=2816244 RepID=UPI00365BFC03